MTTSSNNQEQITTQPLELDVVNQLGIPKGLESLDLSERDLLNFLILLIMQLQREMISSDVWYMTYSTVASRALELGFTDDKVNQIMKVIKQFHNLNRKMNPFTSGGFM